MNELIILLQDVKRQWGTETVAAIVAEMQRQNLSYEGKLQESIAFKQDETLDGNITFGMLDYGQFLDLGVNGARSAYTTPYQYKGITQNDPARVRRMGGALFAWANSKGLNPWAVAWSLQKNGLKPRRFFASVIEQRLAELKPQLELAYTTYLEQQINRQQNP
jgi:hypothetical protein